MKGIAQPAFQLPFGLLLSLLRMAFKVHTSSFLSSLREDRRTIESSMIIIPVMFFHIIYPSSINTIQILGENIFHVLFSKKFHPFSNINNNIGTN